MNKHELYLPAAAAGAIRWMTTPDDCLTGCPCSLFQHSTEYKSYDVHLFNSINYNNKNSWLTNKRGNSLQKVTQQTGHLSRSCINERQRTEIVSIIQFACLSVFKSSFCLLWNKYNSKRNPRLPSYLSEIYPSSKTHSIKQILISIRHLQITIYKIANHFCKKYT